jgi:hypothetical protein
MSGFLCSMVGASFTVAATGQVLRAKRTLTAGGNAKISTAQSKFGGSSIEFDGTDDFVTVTGLPSYANSNYTFECWARFDILPHNQTIGGGSYMMLNHGGSGDYVSISRTGAGSQVSIQIAHANAYGSFTKSGVNYAINTWYHIAVVRNSGVFKVFFNGTDLTTFTNDSGFTNSGRTQDIFVTQLGKFGDSRGSWDGYMDEIRVSNIARYTGDFTPSTTPFIDDADTQLLIHADGTNASTVFEDDNGIGRSQNNGRRNSSAVISTTRSKFGGSSIYLPNDYVTFANDIIFPDNQDFTWEFWVNEDVVQNCKYTGGQTPGDIFIGHDNYGVDTYSNRLAVGVVAVGWYMDFGVTLAADTWYHVCVQRSGDTVYGYTDGTLRVTHTGYLANYSWSWRKLQLSGERDGITLMNGYQDEIRFSNIVRYATAGFTAPTAAFVNDANTVLLVHGDGTNNSTVFTDDNAQLTVTPAATSVNEGSSLTFNVSTVNTSDQTLYYTVTNSGDFGTSSGSFTLASNAGSFSLTPTADTTTEGAETFTASVRLGSTSGDIIATTPSVTINDTSVTSITYPTGVQFERASSERIKVTGFSSNVTGRIQVASAWFKLTSSPTGDETILLAQYNDGNGPILFELTGGNFRHYVHTGTGFTDYQYSKPGGFAAGTWYHVVSKSNTTGSGRRQIWIDGVRVDDQAAFANSTDSFGVGSTNTAANGYGIAHNPAVGAARLWNGCLAQIYWYAGDIDLDANIAKFYNNGYVDFGSAGTTSGLPTPHIYHYGSTQATFDDVRGSLGGSTVTVTGTLATCS